MIGRSLIFVFGVCAIVLALAPGLEGSSEEGSDAALAKNTGIAAQKSAPATAQWYQGGHTLVREGDGHFYADVAVAGAPLRMMVDTGASVIALTAADASAAGLSWNDADVRPIGRGASGDVHGVAAMLSEVEVGGMARHNVQAVIIPEGLDTSLLGQSFLSAIDNVEIADDRMILGAQ